MSVRPYARRKTTVSTDPRTIDELMIDIAKDMSQGMGVVEASKKHKVPPYRITEWRDDPTTLLSIAHRAMRVGATPEDMLGLAKRLAAKHVLGAISPMMQDRMTGTPTPASVAAARHVLDMDTVAPPTSEQTPMPDFAQALKAITGGKS